jgi:tRNA (cmo5U34)-methyltransferase
VEQWNDEAFAQAWVESNTNHPHSPLREEQMDLVLDILRAHFAATQAPHRVLDLGCGAGIVAARVLDGIAGSAVVGVDNSPPMLAMARERLAPYTGRFELARADFETLTPEGLPDGPFAAAIAVQAIHNSTDEGKRRTLSSVRATLAPGGLFVLSDRIRITSAAVFPSYLALWDRLDARYAAQGWQLGEGRTFVEHERSVTERGDKPGSLEQNLLWLREAGFVEAAAVHVVGVRAVVVAVAPR